MREREPRKLKRKLACITVTEIAKKVESHVALGEKQVDRRLVEAGHGSAIESECARRHHRIGYLKGSVAKDGGQWGRHRLLNIAGI